MPDAANVVVATTGGVSGAPTGTPLPTTVSETLNVAFVDVGYISEDGVTQSIAAETNKIKAFQNGDTVREVQTSHDLTYKFAMLETTDETLEVYYGNATAGAVQITGEQGVRQEWVLDVIDGTNLVRVVIPDGQVTARDDVQWQNGAAVSYGVTITCYPDNSGVKAYLYSSVGGGS